MGRIAVLEKRISELTVGIQKWEEYRRTINAALGIYENEKTSVTVEKIEELKECESNRNQVMAERRGHVKAEESMLMRENKRLWFLVRSLTGDKTLEKEMMVETTSDDRGGGRVLINSPFSEDRRPY